MAEDTSLVFLAPGPALILESYQACKIFGSCGFGGHGDEARDHIHVDGHNTGAWSCWELSGNTHKKVWNHHRLWH